MNEQIPEKITLKSWAMMIALAMIWGTSYILIKRGLIAFSPQQVACIRMSLTALVFLPYVLLKFKRIGRASWKHFAVVGFAGSMIPIFLFSLAQTKISSSLAGILNTLTPLFTLLLGILFFKVSATWTKIFGVLLGLGGAGFLLSLEHKMNDWQDAVFGLLVIVACILYALSNNVVKNYLHSTDTVMISAASYLTVGIPALAYLMASDFYLRLTTHEHGWASFGYLVCLSMVGTVLASVLFFKLIKETNALFAASVSYLIPIGAILWGLFDGEPVTVWHLAGMLVILLGVYVARR